VAIDVLKSGDPVRVEELARYLNEFPEGSIRSSAGVDHRSRATGRRRGRRGVREPFDHGELLAAIHRLVGAAGRNERPEILPALSKTNWMSIAARSNSHGVITICLS
jgi:hypothetical protein